MREEDNKQKARFAEERRRMVRYDLRGRGIRDERVLEAMAKVPREEFVSTGYFSEAYLDGPLPIGCGQTISQPYIVALMTEYLRVTSDCEVLEIGTGSGYQTAILSELAKKVYTIERHGQLMETAQAHLAKIGVENVEFFVGDGSCGWPERKVFDRIMVTAAVPEVCEPLIEQLADGGILVAPVGSGGIQRLMVCERKRNSIVERAICGVMFVPLIGEYGFTE